MIKCQRETKVWHRYLIPIYRIVKVRATVVIPDPVTKNLVTVKRVILPFAAAAAFCTSEKPAVKLLREAKVMNRKS